MLHSQQKAHCLLLHCFADYPLLERLGLSWAFPTESFCEGGSLGHSLCLVKGKDTDQPRLETSEPTAKQPRRCWNANAAACIKRCCTTDKFGFIFAFREFRERDNGTLSTEPILRVSRYLQRHSPTQALSE